MSKLTSERAREVLDYDPETGVFRWKISRKSTMIGAVAGSPHLKGYWTVRVGGVLYLGHRLAWLMMTGMWPAHQIDHINCDKSDGRFCNLREATPHQNRGNETLRQNNTSGFKGVSYDKKKGCWYAYITMRGKKRHIGCYSSAEEAVIAYARTADEYFGEFARTV